jgi:large subunit ribosomal protein L25
MSEVTLQATIRKEPGKGTKAMRRDGNIPGIFYGHGLKNIAVSVSEKTLRPLYATTATHIISLKLDDGSQHPCVLKAISFDPVSERPLHFDLFGLNPEEKLTIDVPVKLTGGTPQGVREGGILQHVLHKVKVSCLPQDIPEQFPVDVSTLAMNSAIHVGDLIRGNIEILEDPRATVVAVIPPVVEKEPEVTEEVVAEEGAAEPEVIGKGKKDDDDEKEGDA